MSRDCSRPGRPPVWTVIDPCVSVSLRYGWMRGLVFILLLGSSTAHAAYSPPLIRVRIDEDRTRHAPSILRASEDKTGTLSSVSFSPWGLQYVGQFEWASGLGLQLGAAAGGVDISGTVRFPGGEAFDLVGSGYFLGGQARAYQMLWKSTADAGQRPHALTAFVNVRGLFYHTEDRRRADALTFESLAISGGLGAMAEISVSRYVSVCPYGWITPTLAGRLSYDVAGLSVDSRRGPGIRQPFVVGVDVWLYLFPPNWDDHIALSALFSWIDVEDKGNQTFAGVLGYTF